MKRHDRGQTILEFTITLAFSALLLKGFLTIHFTQEKIHAELELERNEAIRKITRGAGVPAAKLLDSVFSRPTAGLDELVEPIDTGS
ncbi:MAG: hypothetical protein HUU37_05025 [Bdellovibrionales bacterium]|nr:hypothetical protein [Bdellovibrionales bacterium]